MKYILAWVLSILSIAVASAAPRYWCIDQLGGAKYKNEIVQSHPDGFALGIFTEQKLFGDGFPVADAVMGAKRIPLVRYNLRWSDTHSFSRRDFPAIVAEARRGLNVVNKYPNVECEFSGATEHQLNAKDATELARAVLGVIPERCIYVNNPWTGRGAFIVPGPRIKNEVHGKDASRPNVGGRYNWSADGSDVFDFDITKLKQRLNDADVFCFWTSQNNGRKNAGDPTPRPQRRAWPTGNLMQMMAYLATEQGAVSLPKDWLAKPKADQHEVPPEPRALKPVFIVPAKVPTGKKINVRGRMVDEMEPTKTLALRSGGQVYNASKPQPFADGRLRFYFDRFGYQMPGLADVIANGRKYGVTNPGFRQGGFR